MLACESLEEAFPDPVAMIRRLLELQTSSGGFLNDSGFGAATTPVTAAAFGLLLELKQPVAAPSVEWLLQRQCRKGGFAAAPLVLWPDLLSTATALHALNLSGWFGRVPVDACIAFVTELWDESGGFCGHIFDRKADCEYTFYALLSLGTLCGASLG
jgi:hypothetical protein